MLKRVGLVAVAALAAALTLTFTAYADDNDDDGLGYSGHTEQHEVQECDKNLLAGKLIIPEDDGSENNSDGDVDCDQELSPDLDD